MKLTRAGWAAPFGLMLAYAAYQDLGPPRHSARLEVAIEPRMPARIYLWKGNAPFRLAPVDAVLPVKSDLYYRDRLWTNGPNPKVLEVIAGDQYHYMLLEGAATFHLPPGKYRIEAYHGFFHTPAEQEFELKAGDTRRLALPLKPWEGADPAAWISADDHIHLTRSPKDDPVYLGWLQAEDLTLGNFLTLQRQMDAAVQYAFGRKGEARRHGYSIRPGQESRNEFWGHINLLGVNRLIRPMSTGLMYANSPESYPFTSLLFAEGRRAGGTVGYAHFFQPPQHSTLYMDAALGNIDFVEVFQFGVLKIEPWYELLNAGLRVTGIAGSDFPVPLANRKPWPHWLPLLGPERALVKAPPGENTYDAWARGVREGRVVVTNGPLVELAADPRTGHARATAGFYRPLEALEIVQNGRVVAARPGDGSLRRLTLETRLPVAESSWTAARVRAQKRKDEPDIQAHTNPLYLLKDNKPVLAMEARRTLLAKWEKELAYFRSADIVFPNEARRREFFATAERALEALRTQSSAAALMTSPKVQALRSTATSRPSKID
ncbi:MAG: CehA/McbA family metallohydrolase [Acidobacteria bacterium]|nr:CehA/McbA family metallohydrolase [Acidobacteriota bacterium]